MFFEQFSLTCLAHASYIDLVLGAKRRSWKRSARRIFIGRSPRRRAKMRSMIAWSLLERAGHGNVINLAGGFDAWHAAGLPEIVEQLVLA